MIDIDFSKNNGVVTFDDFNLIEGQVLESHIDDLKEDMLQVEFPGGYLLDVGWRPSFEIDGAFHAVLIKGYDWGSPIYSGSAKSLVELKNEINKALNRL